MAGHSKWANIQHRKNAQDAKKGKVFTKLIRALTIAARLGGGEPEFNPRLRDAMNKALAANMSRDTLDRAIKRGAGQLEGAEMEEVRYEGYGPSGVAVIVDCMTDNRKRTVAEVRHAFSKCGGNLGTDGSVAYLFKHMGTLSFAPGSDEAKIMEVALEAGADDVETNEDGSIDVMTTPDIFSAVQQAMLSANLLAGIAEVGYVAPIKVPVDDETAEKVQKLVDMLDDLDDVQEVFTNADS